MFDRFKEFIGIDDNYDDYDDEQLYYDEEDSLHTDNRSKSLDNYNDLLDDDYSNESDKSVTYESGIDSNNNVASFSNNSYSESGFNDYNNTYKSETYGANRFQKSSKRGDNVVSMTDNNFSKGSQMRISIQEPLDYLNDAPIVVNEILNKKVVVLNLEMADTDMRRQIIDFVSGAVYALDGKIEKVTKGIFVITPKGVEVDSSVTEQISDGNYNQL